MQTYNPGDIVICTEPYGVALVRGQAYKVQRRYREYDEDWVSFGPFGDYRAHRFRPATPAEADAAFPPELDLRPPEPTDAAPFAAPAGLPDGNPKTRFGVAKPPIALIPGPALIHMADAFRDGAKKYGPANWRIDPVTTSTYVNAALRHILAYYDGETNAPDSGVHHLGHAAGCLAILLDAEAQGTLNDDRPTPGRTSELIAEKTTPLT
jgi:hypothetical protein